MGAPRNRADRLLTERLSFVLADDELATIKAAAKAAGMTTSTYIRLSTLGTASLPSAQSERILSAGGAAVP